MIRKPSVSRTLALATAGILGAGLASPAFSQVVQTIPFSPTNIGSDQTIPGLIVRGCPLDQELTQVDIQISDLSLSTTFTFTNISAGPDTITDVFATHDHLYLVLNPTNGNIGPSFSVGENNIIPPNRYPPAGTFSCTLPAGANQSQCPDPLPVPMLESAYTGNSWTIDSGADLDFFKSGPDVPVAFRVGARVNANQPGSFDSNQLTQASGTLTVTYTCEDLPPPPPPDPRLSCDFKFMNGQTGPLFIDSPGILNTNFQISVSGVEGTIPVNIIDTLGSPLAYVPGSASIDPNINGNQLQWSANIGPAQPFTMAYQVDASDLQSGETVCNSVSATSSNPQLNSGVCSVCVTYDEPPARIPVAGIPGLALLGMLLAGLGGFHLRQRRRA